MITSLNENTVIRKSTCLANLSAYSATHALIDASCAAIIAANIAGGKANLGDLCFYVILYNTIAFALQAPLGFLADIIKKPAETAILGCIFVLVGIISYKNFSFALIIAGLGNALFHIGGGIISLNLKPGKASLPGVYVATGATGLLIGTLIGKSEYFSIWTFVILLIVASITIFVIRRPYINYDLKSELNLDKLSIIFICIFSSIAIRSLVGFMLTYPWKSNILLLIIFTLAVTFGKAFGGILGDRFGWTRVTVFGLLISAPLLALGIKVPFLAILGVFLFNLTMPVTLTVLAEMLPGRSGFAFGLTTLALIIGALPSLVQLKSIICKNNGLVIFVSVLLMALILKIGLEFFCSIRGLKHTSQKTENNNI